MSHSCIIKDVVTVFQNKTINEALLIMQLIIDYIGYSIYKMSETSLCVCVCVYVVALKNRYRYCL